MIIFKATSLVVLVVTIGLAASTPVDSSENELLQYIGVKKLELAEKYDKYTEAIKDKGKWGELADVMQDIQNEFIEIYRKFKSYPRESIQNPDIGRIIDLWTHYDVQTTTLDERLVWMKNPIILGQKGISPLFCGYKVEGDCKLSYIRDIHMAMAKSSDPDELLYYWKQWREKLGDSEMDTLFELIDVTKSFAEKEDEPTTDLYYFYAGKQDFYQQLLKLYEDLLPLYKQLHAFIRFQLRQKYGEANVPKTGPIPQHLMDQVFAQSWKGVSINYPYPDSAIPNMTETMLANGYTGLKQLEVANSFYESMGLSLPDDFWDHKVHPLTSDKCFGATVGSPKDEFKVDYCPKVDFFSFLREFDNMLELRYKMKYADLPLLLNRETCPGFTEALGISMKLSVLLPSYLKSVDVLDTTVGGDDFEINRLYRLSLYAILPMATQILNDKFWIEASSGVFDRNTINMGYERLLLEMTGVSMPHHDEEYKLILPYQLFRGISYAKPNTISIFAEALGYSLYEGFCKKAGLYDPDVSTSLLKDCNFAGHTEVGNALSEIMSYGGREDWWVITEPVTGKTKLDASGLLEYFKPLATWLEAENKKNGETIGW